MEGVHCHAFCRHGVQGDSNLLLALVASTPLAAAEITGHAHVVNGDTLSLLH